MENNIKVSVLCTVYNHEKYLRKCLDGFVMQKTDFAFEVLIHDDASTDNSASIIKEYEEKYPEIIKPIYQTENQYSQGVSISKKYQIPRIRGKYVATCEGDDYWTDEYKLQKQYDFLETHPEYSMCVHCANSHSVYDNSDKIEPYIKEDCDLSLEEIIEKGGNIAATNSYFMRSELLTTQPDCFKAKGFADYQALIYAAICGRVRCLKDIMSVYNYGSEGSWTSRVWADKDKRISHLREVIRMLETVDEYYDFKYHKPIEKKINKTEFDIELYNENYKNCFSKKYKLTFKELSLKTRVHLFMLAYMPATNKLITGLMK